MKIIQDYVLRMAYETVKDFLEYIGYEGEVTMGYTTPSGHVLDDCLHVTDDEGHGVFNVFIHDLDESRFMGVMCDNHKAPNISEDNFREKYAKYDVTCIGVVRWALGL